MVLPGHEYEVVWLPAYVPGHVAVSVWHVTALLLHERGVSVI